MLRSSHFDRLSLNDTWFKLHAPLSRGYLSMFKPKFVLASISCACTKVGSCTNHDNVRPDTLMQEANIATHNSTVT
jgi:hypothetical protein